jgi:glucuronoarabinoxylan endo-1,4-beta-xylanase
MRQSSSLLSNGRGCTFPPRPIDKSFVLAVNNNNQQQPMKKTQPAKKLKQRLPVLQAVAAIAAATVVMEVRAGDCVVNAGSTLQTIDGIGFSSAWCGQLSSAKNNALYNTLGMSLLRIRIDPNRSWSQEAANSSAAHGAGAKVIGSCWTPPANMKNNNNLVQGSLLTSQYGNYATFLRDAANTINLDWVSFQNEPDITVTYESCRWTPTELLNFTKNNSATIGRSIAMAESFNFNDSYTDPTLNDSTAASRVSRIAGHIYGGGNNVHQNALNKGKPVWMTEHFINGQNIGTAVSIAKEITDCMNNRMSAYYWWWVQDTDNNVNLVNTSGTIFKNAYGLGQYAKWVRPGKQRIAATYQPTPGVYVTAYKNNGLVVVAVNTTSSTVWQTFSLQNVSGVSSMIVHRTTSSLNMANVGTSTVANNSFGMNLPPQSISTAHQF